MGGTSAAAECTAPAGDIISENFGATPDATWTAVTLTPTYGHTLEAGAPEGSCTTGVNLVLSSTSNRERIHTPASVATNVTVDIKFSIYFNSYNVAEGAALNLLSLHEDNEGSSVNGVQLVNSGGTYSLRGFGTGASTAVNIATATWYEVTLHLDATAASSYFQVNGGDQYAITRSTAGGDAAYLVIGKNHSTDRQADFDIGYVSVNTP